jgi:Tfp pilus assembly protein PilF
LAEALQKNPQHLGAMDILLRVHEAEQSLSAGLSALSAHVVRHPESARLQYYMGERMLAAGRRDEARRLFLAALAADRNFAQALLASAQMDYEDGKLEPARRSLAALPPTMAAGPVVHLLLAAIESRAGNPQAAQQHYQTVLQADPDQVVALNNLAYLLATYQNRADEALKYAQRAMELAPDNPDVSGTMGWLHYRRGLYPTALQHLQAAVSRDGTAAGPRQAARRVYLGMTYLKLGDRRQGMTILEQSLRSNPGLPEAELARAAIREASNVPAQ